jgi:hypothetical protein
VQLFSYLNGGYLCQMMKLPTAQEKSKLIFLGQPKAHQFKLAETNKMVPTDPFQLVAFLSSVRLPMKQPASLTSSRRRSSQRKRRKLIFPLLAAMTQTTGIIIARTMTTIKVTSAIATNANMIVAIETFDATITLVTKRRTAREGPTRRKMTANAITSKRRTTRSCTTTTPLCQARTFCQEIGVTPCQGLLFAHAPILALAQTAAKGATQIIMSLMMIANKAFPSSASIFAFRQWQ